MPKLLKIALTCAVTSGWLLFVVVAFASGRQQQVINTGGALYIYRLWDFVPEVTAGAAILVCLLHLAPMVIDRLDPGKGAGRGEGGIPEAGPAAASDPARRRQ